MIRTSLRHTLATIGSAMLAAACLVGSPAFAGGPNKTNTCNTNIPIIDTYNGRATDLSIYAGVAPLLGSPISVGTSIAEPFRISDTGELGPTTVENTKESHLLSVDLPLPSASSPLVRAQAGILDAVTTGMGNTTTSWANIVGLNLTVGSSLAVAGGVIQATATATRNKDAKCSASGAAPTAPTGQQLVTYDLKSHIVDLKISVNGIDVPIPVNAPPNTQIEVPGVLTVVLNEHGTKSNGNRFVNAVHITLGDPASPLALLATADIVIGHAEANISPVCGSSTTTCPPPCKAKDFMTGGGWITLTGGAKGTFGFNGGYKPNGLRGHLTYIDHGTGQKITGTDVVIGGYVATGATSRDITYVCGELNCLLSVGDFGEPGGNVDTFSLLRGGYGASGPMITKGNIQIHRSSCPATTTSSGTGRKNR